MTSEHTVEPLSQDSLEATAEQISRAFADDPIWKWIYGCEDSVPLSTAIGLARRLVSQHTSIDRMLSLSNLGAIALWTAPSIDTTDEIEEVRDTQSHEYSVAFAQQLGERIETSIALGAEMKRHRPQETHWYLGILGTEPERQNEGLGSALLQHMLNETDQLGLPTYLESSNPRNYAFYRRHGYDEIASFSVLDSPPMKGFWRPVY